MKTITNIICPVIAVYAIICSTLSPTAEAVSPAPDGGYAGGNTAEGQSALLSLTSGTYNTAIGYLSLLSNTTNSFNTAIGAGALLASTASGNTAVGAGALLSNTTGIFNTANGGFALVSDTQGSSNTAIGYNALLSNTIGDGNVAIGNVALYSNTNGSGNVAIGNVALYSKINGDDNTAIGASALDLSTGAGNIAIGFNAGGNLTTGDNNIYLGSLGVASESNTIRIGTSGVQTSAFIRGIRGVTTGNNDAIPVLVDSAGQLGTTSSSRRFKKEIKPMDSASEAILALKPVTFHYMTDKTGTPQFGLIAEEVAEVNPNLVVRDENGEIYTVRYDAVNAMLLNEFLKEHKKVEEQQSKIESQTMAIVELKSVVAQQQKATEILSAQLKEQAEQIQRVSAQTEVSRAKSGVVKNDR